MNAFMLVIEPDGGKMPAIWYRRLARRGLKVGREKEKTEPVLKRRVSSGTAWHPEADDSVIFQEGCVISRSEKLVNELFLLAKDCANEAGITLTAQIFAVSPREFTAAPGDLETFARIEGRLSRRGRPSGTKQDWVVTCHDCASTSHVQEELFVIDCPLCHSGNIHSRPGELSALRMPKDGNAVENWLRHRFATGEFEIPDLGNEAPPMAVEVTGKAAATVKEMSNPDFVSDIEKLPGPIQATYLDAVLVARTWISVATRQEARSRAILTLYQRGVKDDELSIFHIDELSILDSAAIVGPDQAAYAWSTIHKNRKD